MANIEPASIYSETEYYSKKNDRLDLQSAEKDQIVSIMTLLEHGTYRAAKYPARILGKQATGDTLSVTFGFLDKNFNTTLCGDFRVEDNMIAMSGLKVVCRGLSIPILEGYALDYFDDQALQLFTDQENLVL